MDDLEFIQVFKSLCDKTNRLKESLEIIKCADNHNSVDLLKTVEDHVRFIEERLEVLNNLLTTQRQLYEDTKVAKIEAENLLYRFNRLEELVTENKENDSNLINNEEHLLINQASNYSLNTNSTPQVNSNYADCSPVCGSSSIKLLPKCIVFGISYITKEEFQLLPKYMCGRLTIQQINEFVDVVNKVLHNKYNLLSQPKSSLKKNDLLLYNDFKHQEISQLKGKHFITEKDIAREYMTNILDKKTSNMLIILRHCKKLLRHVFNGKLYLTTD